MSNNWIQKFFNPIDFCFTWTNDWYEWNSLEAKRLAKEARNNLAKELKVQGYEVHKTSLSGQLVRRGGIGSGHPDVEFFVNCPGLNAYRK